MGTSALLEPDQPIEYSSGDVLPFAPEGDSPLVDGCVDLVEGIAGRFKGMRCARKTVILRAHSHEASFRRQLTREARALYNARHTHVIQLVYTYFDNRSEKLRFSVVMDRAEASLSDYLDPGTAKANLPQLKWFGCLSAAIKHIHSLGIRHRDINPATFL